MASTDKPNGGASFPTQDTAAAAAAAGYENNGELPTYLLSPELADPAGRRPLTMLPPPPPLPPSSISPMPSPYLGGIGLVPPLVVSTAFQNPPLVPPVMYAAGHTMAPMVRSSSNNENNWREPTEEMRRLRARNVILVERMLTNHQPHDVLTQVPENFNWHSKTFALAIKIERLMFASATSRENYLDEATLRSRVQILSRHLVRIRKRKNAMASAYANT